MDARAPTPSYTRRPPAAAAAPVTFTVDPNETREEDKSPTTHLQNGQQGGGRFPDHAEKKAKESVIYTLEIVGKG